MRPPTQFWPEASSVLHELVWRGSISRESSISSLDLLRSGLIQCREPDGLHREAWHVADRLGWAKTYDAEYVALARILDCPLLTVDQRLRRGAAGMVMVVGPTELQS
ncbi:MAG: type II toxin-antitoxin system VapC family toxin [Actinomycetota bacterium]